MSGQFVEFLARMLIFIMGNQINGKTVIWVKNQFEYSTLPQNAIEL